MAKSSKRTLKRRAAELGCEAEFRAVRENLKMVEGMAPDAAWLEAARRVFPQYEPALATPAGGLPVAGRNSGRGSLSVRSQTSIGDILCDIDEFASLEGELRKVVEWVANHLAVRNVRPADAPCSMAWAMLHWVRDPYNPKNMSDFFNNVLPKLLPSKKQLDDEDRFKDDGRELDKTIEAALALAAREADAA
jgi:hypothetical protein